VDIKKTGGPGATDAIDAPDASRRSDATRGPETSFGERVGEAAASPPDLAPSLETALVDVVEAVRRGEIAPEAAIDHMIELSRETLASVLPPEVDMDEALGYIRETLENDPAFLALLEGTVPGGS